MGVYRSANPAAAEHQEKIEKRKSKQKNHE
jgi:hypothetical protein